MDDFYLLILGNIDIYAGGSQILWGLTLASSTSRNVADTLKWQTYVLRKILKLDSLEGRHDPSLGVNDLIRDLNRLTSLNDLAPEHAQPEPN